MNQTCRTYELLTSPQRLALLVSLPGNALDLAKAARDGGAQGLKVHINISHAASGIHFGSLAEEAAVLEQIVALGLPVGIVPGDKPEAVKAGELAQLAAMGLDFCDAYLAALPAWMLSDSPLPLMAAVGVADLPQPSRVEALGTKPAVQMVEASIIPHEGYGNALSVADLCDYTVLARLLRPHGCPVLVPTQRRIGLEDLPSLAATGVGGLLIGAIVTGTEPRQLQAVTQKYAEALATIPCSTEE